ARDPADIRSACRGLGRRRLRDRVRCGDAPARHAPACVCRSSRAESDGEGGSMTQRPTPNDELPIDDLRELAGTPPPSEQDAVVEPNEIESGRELTDTERYEGAAE